MVIHRGGEDGYETHDAVANALRLHGNGQQPQQPDYEEFNLMQGSGNNTP